MRIPDLLLNCVGFLCEGSPTQLQPKGTAFFVSVPSERFRGRTYPYVVTAKHCVTNSRGPLFLRLNKSDGGFGIYAVEATWIHATDPSADVVAIQWGPSDPRVTWTHIAADIFATPERIAEHDIGVGDDIAMIGLFVKHAGQTKNLPVMRTGIISAMPAEPLRDRRTGLSFSAYVAEVRSIGGLSGSPVFALLEPGRIHNRRVTFTRHVLLLGIVRGHWDLDNSETLLTAAGEGGRINMGMAVITPLDGLISIVNSEAQVANRRAHDDRYATTLSPDQLREQETQPPTPPVPSSPPVT